MRLDISVIERSHILKDIYSIDIDKTISNLLHETKHFKIPTFPSDLLLGHGANAHAQIIWIAYTRRVRVGALEWKE